MAEVDSSQDPNDPNGATQARIDPLKGRILNGRFKILEPIGAGGMGRVYKAIQSPLDRLVAVKVLHPQYSSKDQGFVRRFVLEASLTSKLRHPNTVTVIDYGQTEDGVFYIAMEYLEGRTVADVLTREGPLSWERALHISQQVCRSLREAHKFGIIHRDLKPANVMLLDEADNDQVKVLDFGLVKSFLPEAAGAAGEEGQKITQAGMLLGSPQYMAPEQARNHSDPRSDVYSFGVLLYEMLTGKAPFMGKDYIEVIVKHMKEPPPPFRAMRPDLNIPPHVEGLVMRCLQKDPAARFQSMDEILEAMRAIGGVPMGVSGAHARPSGSYEAAGPTPMGMRAPGSGEMRAAPSTPAPRTPSGTLLETPTGSFQVNVNSGPYPQPSAQSGQYNPPQSGQYPQPQSGQYAQPSQFPQGTPPPQPGQFPPGMGARPPSGQYPQPPPGAFPPGARPPSGQYPQPPLGAYPQPGSSPGVRPPSGSYPQPPGSGQYPQPGSGQYAQLQPGQYPQGAPGARPPSGAYPQPMTGPGAPTPAPAVPAPLPSAPQTNLFASSTSESSGGKGLWIALVLLLLVGGGGAVWWFGLRAKPAPAPQPVAQTEPKQDAAPTPPSTTPAPEKTQAPPAQQATAAAGKPVRFKVSSEPSGARVFMGARDLGTTPLTFEMPAQADGTATAELVFILDGYHPLAATAGGSGDVVLSQKLQRKSGGSRGGGGGSTVVASASGSNSGGDVVSTSFDSKIEAPTLLAADPKTPPKEATSPAAVAAQAPSKHEVLPFGEGMSRPEQLSGQPINYTREAIQAKIEGLMIVKCVINTGGRVENCRVMKSLPYMEKAVLDALYSRVYKPITYQGKPVAVDYVFDVRLVLPKH